MRPFRRSFLMTTAALVAAVVLYFALTLPPATQHLGPRSATTIYGAYHVHTLRSDGSGSLDDVAVAAAAAGLQFVIVTDHGDGTRTPEPPRYRHGVLVIDAVEISTTEGHLVAVGLRDASPYPLGGEARDTLEDVHRMGGWTVAAHPDSPRVALQWRGGDLPVDGVEWLNADSEWRDEGPGRLLLTLGHYLWRPPESIASLFERPQASLRRWDEALRTRAVVGLAGVDAHAKIGLDEDAETQESRTLFARPSYADMFRTVASGITLRDPLTGDSLADAAFVMRALRTGQVFSVMWAVAEPGEIVFSATDGNQIVRMGESLTSEGPVTVSASLSAPAAAELVLLRDGMEVVSGARSLTYRHTGSPATYRVEARLPGVSVPWIVTNAIRIGAWPSVAAEIRAIEATPIFSLDNPGAWSGEKHAGSGGDVQSVDGEVALTFQLAPGRLNGQYAAMSYPIGGRGPFNVVTATLRASSPMRVSLQLRHQVGEVGQRWQRSVYVDETPREVVLRLTDFHGAGAVSTTRPDPALVQSLMLVVDTWHTKPGASGTVWLSGVSLGATSAR